MSIRTMLRGISLPAFGRALFAPRHNPTLTEIALAQTLSTPERLAEAHVRRAFPVLGDAYRDWEADEKELEGPFETHSPEPGAPAGAVMLAPKRYFVARQGNPLAPHWVVLDGDTPGIVGTYAHAFDARRAARRLNAL